MQKKLKIGDPLSIETDVGPLIRNQEVNRVEKMVDETLSSKMGELLLGGKRISNSLFSAQFYEIQIQILKFLKMKYLGL